MIIRPCVNGAGRGRRYTPRMFRGIAIGSSMQAAGTTTVLGGSDPVASPEP